MISVFLQGGLGNQLFQIACGYAHSIEVGDSFCLQDGQHHLPLQGNRVEIYKDTFYKDISFVPEVTYSSIYEEPTFTYSSELINEAIENTNKKIDDKQINIIEDFKAIFPLSVTILLFIMILILVYVSFF